MFRQLGALVCLVFFDFCDTVKGFVFFVRCEWIGSSSRALLGWWEELGCVTDTGDKGRLFRTGKAVLSVTASEVSTPVAEGEAECFPRNGSMLESGIMK